MAHAAKNLLLIVADALRLDSVQASMPRLSKRMTSWCRFPTCVSSAPWTLPSCTTLLTGVSASRHARFEHDTPLWALTLAERLGPEYRRIGLVTNTNLKPGSGLERGFDSYEYFDDNEELFEVFEEQLSRGLGFERPYFALLHSNIPHDYYLSTSRRYAAEASGWFEIGRRVIDWTGLDDEERERVRGVYEHSVDGLDRSLERILSRVDPANTIICFVADHGEGFDFQRGRIHHGGRVHDDLVRVPLAMSLPHDVRSDVRDALDAAASNPVATADIVPTLLAIANGRSTGDFDGRDLTASGEDAGPRTLTSEEWRYLYLSSRQRINRNWRGKNTTARKRAQNLALRFAIARQFGTKAFLEYPYKLIATCLQPTRLLPERSARKLAGSILPGAPVLRVDRGTVWGLEVFDVGRDPQESENLLRTDGPPTVGALREFFRAPESFKVRTGAGVHGLFSTGR